MKNKRFWKVLLKITKYTFIIFILGFTILFVALFIYSKKLNYELPKVIDIEIYDNNDNLLFKKNNTSNKNYVYFNDISPSIIEAFLSIEDKDYYSHQGVNFKRILGALLSDIKSGTLSQGGSTITQQYVKNVFLSSEKTFKRKIEEALIAINIESKYTKDEILEGYLNTIYFDHGIYGIYDACLFYFNKLPSEITVNEAAMLAGIPKSPSNYSPIKNPENNDKRRKLILSEMLNDGKITSEEYSNLLNEVPTIYGKLDRVKISNAPYYIDTILNDFNNSFEFKKIDRSGGIRIYTNIDSNLNKIIENAINKYKQNSEIEIAIMAIDTKGKVLASVGGCDYLQSTYNRTKSLRQPGSTIKTFLYYAALENGFNVSSTFYSAPTVFYYNGEEYSPSNYNNIYPYQDVSMAYAIATSDNMYAMKTHLFLGPDKLYSTLKSFGFTSNISKNPSLALGTSEVSLEELTLGYAKIGSLGKDITSTYIDKITDLNNNILYKSSYNDTQKFNSTTCFLLSEALTNVFDGNVRINISPTCSQINQMLTQKYAAKSGSTDYDGLIVGYNNNITLGIWTGYDDNRVLEKSEAKYIKYIWAYIMENYNKNKKNTWFKTPSNVISIRLNPINGNIGMYNEYQKYLYYEIDNLPEFLY